MKRATTSAITFGGILALSAASLTTGCKSTAPSESAATETVAAPTAITEVDVSDVTPLAIKSAASAEMGGPASYTLTLITSADDLPAAVSEQGLEVDFETHDVVLLGMGELATSGYDAEITGIQQVGNTLYVQANFTHPAPDALVNQVVTRPWAAAAIYKRKPGVTLRSDFN